MSKTKASMRLDWNERARLDAFHYIASWRKDWDQASFFASGEKDFQELVAPILERLAFAVNGKGMAEIGCGVGRMTRSFASRFRTVIAIDVSEEMLARAKSNLSDLTNVQYVLSDGQSLADLPTGTLDFVFSYLVLQHFPFPELVDETIREMLRALKPEGAYLFQFNGSDRPTMNWKGVLITSLLDALMAVGLRRFSQFIAKTVNIDPQMVGGTWRGVALSSSEISQMVKSAGGGSSRFIDEASPLAWCYGQKNHSQSS